MDDKQRIAELEAENARLESEMGAMQLEKMAFLLEMQAKLEQRERVTVQLRESADWLITEHNRLKAERDRYHAALYGIVMGLSLSRSEIIEMAHDALHTPRADDTPTEGA